MRFTHLPLVGALALSAPAFAITVNMTDFVFPGAGNVNVNGGATGPSYSGAAGEFAGTLDNTPPGAPTGVSSLAFTNADATGTSFRAWCAELTQSFNFGVNYQYEQDLGVDYFGAPRVTALSRLFTAAQGFVVDSTTSAAMQAGIWEIIYEQGTVYDLSGGSFTAAPQDPAGQAAFATVNSFLTNLSSYSASYRIDVLGSDSSQDFLVATVPEPSTWALLLGGLGAVGAIGRRNKAKASAVTA